MSRLTGSYMLFFVFLFFFVPKDADTEFDLILFSIERMLPFDSLCAKCMSYATGCGYDWDVNAFTCSHFCVGSSSARCLILVLSILLTKKGVDLIAAFKENSMQCV